MGALGLIDERRYPSTKAPDWTAKAQIRFLAAYSECGSAFQASRWAKVSKDMHFKWMRVDPSYPPRFREADARATRRLLDEAVRRAAHGLTRPVLYKGKPVFVNGEMVVEKEYSDTLLIALLKAKLPEQFRERVENTHKFQLDPAKMTDEERTAWLEANIAIACGNDPQKMLETRKMLEAEADAQVGAASTAVVDVKAEEPK